MKKLLLAVAFMTSLYGANAQSQNDGNLNVGVHLGMNISSVNGDKTMDDYKSKIGFHLGVAADYKLIESLFLESGLYVTTKGAKYKKDGIKNIYSLTYLQLPVLATYKYELGNDLKLHGKVGPYFALGVAAKNKWEDSDSPEEAETIKGFGKSSDDKEKTGLKRGDIGLMLGIGASKGHYYLGLNYELGLTNLCIEEDWGKDAKAKNRNFTITLGYNF